MYQDANGLEKEEGEDDKIRGLSIGPWWLLFVVVVASSPAAVAAACWCGCG